MDDLLQARQQLETPAGADPDFTARTLAFRRIERLAIDGDVAAMVLLGHLQRTASPTIPPAMLDQSSGQEWLRAAARAGSLEAQIELATALAAGEGAWIDSVEACHWLRIAADAGDRASRDQLLDLYWNRHEAKPEPEELLRRTRQAAEDGHVEAAYRLGRLLRFGEGAPADPATAFTWFLRAAEGGERRAFHHLGEMTFLGEGVAQDHAASIPYFERSNLNSSLYYLGLCRRDGLGCPRDSRAAHEHFLTGSSPGGPEYGDRRAQHALGRMHEEIHCGCNYPGIALWYQIAAEAGLPVAQYDLGRLHELGLEVPCDVERARHWYGIAAQAGHAEARAALERLEGR